jgi:hypothetical protein
MARKPTRQRGEIEARASGSLRVRVYAGVDALTGRRHYLTESVPAGPKAYAEAEKIRRRLVNQVDEQRNPRTKATVNQLMDRYLELLDVEETTLERYEQAIRIHIRPLLGHLPVAKLDGETLDAHQAILRRCRAHCDGRPHVEHAADGPHDCSPACKPHVCRPLATSSIRKVHFCLSGALARAVRWRWISVNPLDQVTARYQVRLGVWPRRAKWCAFGATYLMNTWTSWGLNGEPLSVSGVVLHSVPPLLVVLSAETGPVLRDRPTEATRQALTDSSTGREHQRTAQPPDVAAPIVNSATTTAGAVHTAALPAVHAAASPTVHGVVSGPVHEPESEAVREPASSRGEPQVGEPAVHERQVDRARPGSDGATGQHQLPRRFRRRTPVRRRLLDDYLAEARAALADATVTGQRPDPTPTWCRRTTGCSAGTSVKLAAALRAATDQPPDAPAADGLPGTKPTDVEGAPVSVDHVEREVVV